MILARYGDAAAAGAALAAEVAGALHEGLLERGAGALAVPGGRTPVPLFASLREQALDWSRVHVTLTDERWVPEASPASNAALVRAELLRSHAATARFHPLYDGSASAGSAAARVWLALQRLPRPFDAVVLGMGEDGHFASLFAGSPGIAQALDPEAVPACVAMQAPTQPAQRLSLNLAALRQTRRVFLFATGEAKRELLLRAERDAVAAAVPIAALLALRHPQPEVFWAA